MSKLIHLIYNSRAAAPFSDEDLIALLGAARNKNASLGITGMLLYINGTFFQVLEGDPEFVDQLAATIQADPRHDRMTVIIREPIAKRSFSEWTMGFVRMNAEDAEQIEGMNDFFGAGQALSDLDAGRAKKLLGAFQQGRWRLTLAAPEPKVALPRARAATAPPRRAEEPRPDFTFAFQPIVDAAERRAVGYEALIRGNDMETAAQVLQRVPLGEVPAFDEDARRVAIGLARRLGLKGLLHLNVMPQLWRQDVDTIESTLQTASRCGLDPARLVLEVKHEATVSDPAALGAMLRGLRDRGVRLSIDDFGSGHAGLALLEHYQPDMISLHMGLVRQVDSHGPRQAILRGLIQTCSDLAIDIVAKGVETLDEYAWLRDAGFTLFQGFLFARPGMESLPRPMLPADAG